MSELVPMDDEDPGDSLALSQLEEEPRLKYDAVDGSGRLGSESQSTPENPPSPPTEDRSPTPAQSGQQSSLASSFGELPVNGADIVNDLKVFDEARPSHPVVEVAQAEKEPSNEEPTTEVDHSLSLCDATLPPTHTETSKIVAPALDIVEGPEPSENCEDPVDEAKANSRQVDTEADVDRPSTGRGERPVEATERIQSKVSQFDVPSVDSTTSVIDNSAVFVTSTEVETEPDVVEISTSTSECAVVVSNTSMDSETKLVAGNGDEDAPSIPLDSEIWKANGGTVLVSDRETARVKPDESHTSQESVESIITCDPNHDVGDGTMAAVRNDVVVNDDVSFRLGAHTTEGRQRVGTEDASSNVVGVADEDFTTKEATAIGLSIHLHSADQIPIDIPSEKVMPRDSNEGSILDDIEACESDQDINAKEATTRDCIDVSSDHPHSLHQMPIDIPTERNMSRKSKEESLLDDDFIFKEACSVVSDRAEPDVLRSEATPSFTHAEREEFNEGASNTFVDENVSDGLGSLQKGEICDGGSNQSFDILPTEANAAANNIAPVCSVLAEVTANTEMEPEMATDCVPDAPVAPEECEMKVSPAPLDFDVENDAEVTTVDVVHFEPATMVESSLTDRLHNETSMSEGDGLSGLVEIAKTSAGSSERNTKDVAAEATDCDPELLNRLSESGTDDRETAKDEQVASTALQSPHTSFEESSDNNFSSERIPETSPRSPSPSEHVPVPEVSTSARSPKRLTIPAVFTADEIKMNNRKASPSRSPKSKLNIPSVFSHDLKSSKTASPLTQSDVNKVPIRLAQVSEPRKPDLTEPETSNVEKLQATDITSNFNAEAESKIDAHQVFIPLRNMESFSDLEGRNEKTTLSPNNLAVLPVSSESNASAECVSEANTASRSILTSSKDAPGADPHLSPTSSAQLVPPDKPGKIVIPASFTEGSTQSPSDYDENVREQGDEKKGQPVDEAVRQNKSPVRPKKLLAIPAAFGGPSADNSQVHDKVLSPKGSTSPSKKKLAIPAAFTGSSPERDDVAEATPRIPPKCKKLAIPAAFSTGTAALSPSKNPSSVTTRQIPDVGTRQVDGAVPTTSGHEEPGFKSEPIASPPETESTVGRDPQLVGAGNERIARAQLLNEIERLNTEVAAAKLAVAEASKRSETPPSNCHTPVKVHVEAPGIARLAVTEDTPERHYAADKTPESEEPRADLGSVEDFDAAGGIVEDHKIQLPNDLVTSVTDELPSELAVLSPINVDEYSSLFRNAVPPEDPTPTPDAPADEVDGNVVDAKDTRPAALAEPQTKENDERDSAAKEICCPVRILDPSPKNTTEKALGPAEPKDAGDSLPSPTTSECVESTCNSCSIL